MFCLTVPYVFEPIHFGRSVVRSRSLAWKMFTISFSGDAQVLCESHRFQFTYTVGAHNKFHVQYITP